MNELYVSGGETNTILSQHLIFSSLIHTLINEVLVMDSLPFTEILTVVFKCLYDATNFFVLSKIVPSLKIEM